MDTEKFDKTDWVTITWNGDDETRVSQTGSSEKITVKPGDKIEVTPRVAETLVKIYPFTTEEEEAPKPKKAKKAPAKKAAPKEEVKEEPEAEPEEVKEEQPEQPEATEK